MSTEDVQASKIQDENQESAVITKEASSNSSFDAKQKKKLDKLADSLFKKSNISNAPVDDKYYHLIQYYVDLQEQMKKIQLNSKEVEKTVANVNKQKELIQNDYNKSLLAKDKLESLCRELQRHNKIIKEENLQRIKEEEEKRKDITSKFQVAIDEINQQVGSNSDKNNLLVQENAQLGAKLKNLLEQYEIREQHIEKVLKHKDLEIELANAKLQQSELKLVEATERGKSEKQIFEKHIVELGKKCEFHQESEKQLRTQLAMYTEKYEEFQTTLKKSNEVFESFRSEMDKMTKKIKKLEQETASWKNKWESCDKSLQNVNKQKEDLDDKCKKAIQRADMMEKLSRTLQTERNELKEQLKKYQAPEPVANPEPEVQPQEEPKTEPEQQAEPQHESSPDKKPDPESQSQENSSTETAQ